MSVLTEFILDEIDRLSDQTALALEPGRMCDAVTVVTCKRLILAYEAMYQIVAKRSHVERAEDDPDLVLVVLALGMHDPTVRADLHDDNLDPLAYLRSKR